MSGIAILHWFHSLRNPGLDKVMSLITDLHSETIYILVLPLIYWLIDKRLARHLAAAFAYGMAANELLKELFHTQRPYVSHPELDPPPHVIETATGSAFPSGHAMNPLIFWGLIANAWKRRWLTLVVGIGVFLIGISRLYFGVHWPLDVLGGWVIGALLLWVFIRTARFWRGEGQGLRMQLVLAIVPPLVVLAVAAFTLTGTQLHQLVALASAYLGMTVGFALEEAFVRFDPRAGSVASQIFKVLVGYTLLLGFQTGFKVLFGASEPVTFVRYLLAGLSATYLLPLIWSRLVTKNR